MTQVGYVASVGSESVTVPIEVNDTAKGTVAKIAYHLLAHLGVTSGWRSHPSAMGPKDLVCARADPASGMGWRTRGMVKLRVAACALAIPMA